MVSPLSTPPVTLPEVLGPESLTLVGATVTLPDRSRSFVPWCDSRFAAFSLSSLNNGSASTAMAAP